MALPEVTISHPDINSGTAVSIPCDKITVSGKTSAKADPYVNGGTAQAHKQTYENLTYKVNGVHLRGNTGELNYSYVLQLYRAAYDGTNPAELTIKYGSVSRVLGNAGGESTASETYTEVASITPSHPLVGNVLYSASSSGSGFNAYIRITFEYSDGTSDSTSTFNSVDTVRGKLTNPNPTSPVSAITVDLHVESGSGETVTLDKAVAYGVVEQLPRLDGTVTTIPVILKSFDLPLDTTQSEGAYMPIMSLDFVETSP